MSITLSLLQIIWCGSRWVMHKTTRTLNECGLSVLYKNAHKKQRVLHTCSFEESKAFPIVPLLLYVFLVRSFSSTLLCLSLTCVCAPLVGFRAGENEGRLFLPAHFSCSRWRTQVCADERGEDGTGRGLEALLKRCQTKPAGGTKIKPEAEVIFQVHLQPAEQTLTWVHGSVWGVLALRGGGVWGDCRAVALLRMRAGSSSSLENAGMEKEKKLFKLRRVLSLYLFRKSKALTGSPAACGSCAAADAPAQPRSQWTVTRLDVPPPAHLLSS